MNIALWIVQVLLAVVDVPLRLMRFVAFCEVLGVVGIIVPHATGVLAILTPWAAIGLGLIMVPAARIHLGLGEPTTAAGNLILFAACAFVAVGRWPA